MTHATALDDMYTILLFGNFYSTFGLRGTFLGIILHLVINYSLTNKNLPRYPIMIKLGYDID